MLKLAQTDQETDQQTNTPTDQQTGQKQYVPHYYTLGKNLNKFEPGISIMSILSKERMKEPGIKPGISTDSKLEKAGNQYCVLSLKEPGISTSRELSRESSQEIVLSILSAKHERAGNQYSVLSLKEPGIILSILSILSLKQPGIKPGIILSRSSTEKEPQWKTMRILV
ncbi:hypothetical protein DPMN_079038 [Dreissena polymorpha]|uniref:Uncharacterized protein n=1 Tax=Dreissena polymorpha TaxID=45954 RepID=A0A9D4BPP2_DREPO|nr:hypothetical protein DPMN_079038 [Dreissena polymorpha]